VKAEPFIKPKPSTFSFIKRARAAFRELFVLKRNITTRIQARAITAPVKEDNAKDRVGANADTLRQAD
jgi:hypothetical protein